MSTLTTRYITDEEMDAMAQAAFASYELTADWGAAERAAREYAADEMGVRTYPPQSRLAVRLAQIKWEAARMQVLNPLLRAGKVRCGFRAGGVK